MKKIFAILTIMLLISSCGTIFKSERNFKTSSDVLDYDILILDSLGLVALVIPGIVMITTDYITGAIYLSPKEASGFKNTLQRTSINLITE